ncbi:hypothetical protein SELMODRAFT_78179 [Selaginella moellendorffii]|uniref:Pentacotripeptide-repeat region of PRORP domain-containing protein n=2 Tax=Selaginella moellendorffii TaxID=88036 RepID=D8QVV6_SELML|nr:hypothetical protein SELMODRAFT_112582 [Selaginella moellendorffii]EFJ36523.1 hypothetical protein SELMODRAFT_78179 [Selaginella moellendorffii]
MLAVNAQRGHLDQTKEMFEVLPDQDVVSWNTVIMAFSQAGQLNEALLFFQEMCLNGVTPDQVTFTNVLAVCSHIGVTEKACGYFTSMVGDHGIAPAREHYGAIIDNLARSGELEEAEELVTNMPYKPGEMEWSVLLSACSSYKDLERGKRVAQVLEEIMPDEAANYVSLFKVVADSNTPV